MRERRAPEPEEAPCASFEEAYARFGERVYYRALRMLGGDASAAEDVSQQVFIRLDRRIREKKRVPHPLRPVLDGLVDDAVKNHLRGERRRRWGGEPDEEMPSSKPDPEQLLSRTQEGCRIEAIFARMDRDDVEILALAHGEEELSQKDVAARFGLDAGTLRVKLHRARAVFADLYFRLHGGDRRRS